MLPLVDDKDNVAGTCIVGVLDVLAEDGDVLVWSVVCAVVYS